MIEVLFRIRVDSGLIPLLLVIFTVFQGCKSDSTENHQDQFPEGKKLSEIYCVSCHLPTTPEILDRISWDKVLLQMKGEMDDSGYSIAEEDWVKIQQYYLQNAPSELPQPAGKKGLTQPADFITSTWSKNLAEISPYITSLNWDTLNRILYVGDLNGRLMVLDQAKLVTTYQLENIPVQAHYHKASGQLEVLGMGSFMPSHEKTGQLLAIDPMGGVEILIDSLQRPVHFLKADLNEDGHHEYLISSFGSTEGVENSGRLSLFIPEQGHYAEKVIKELPGALKSAIIDHNRDGLMDIVALFAQGKEALYLFTNLGGHRFEERLIQEFIPVHGSNDFELRDINGDTYPDIIMTNGDNGDNSPIFKYYHGVRILLNDGSFRFKEAFSYPLNGASKVICRDFDHDQDIDFVVLSMYPDLIRWKNETLVYFENNGDFSFSPQFLETEPSGRWILAEAGDINADGFQDLIVGSNMRIQGVLTPPRLMEQWKSIREPIQIFTKSDMDDSTSEAGSQH